MERTEAQVELPEQTDPSSDQQLVADINAGDAAAFETLYLRYRDWVASLAHRFTGSEDLALDVMQETFLYLLRKFPGFRLTAHLKTFLYPAVKNLSIAARKKAGRYQSTETEQLDLLEFPDAVETPGGSEDLKAALAGLSAGHREVLWLRFVEGMPLAEVAEALGVPLGTVKSRLHFALQSLRDDPRTRSFFE